MLDFFKNLDGDIRRALKAQIRNLWTHESVAIEGNSLTLGETAFVIEEGLTVSGKPLKDHQEVAGHARAIDLIYDMAAGSRDITESDLFLLRKAIVMDVYKPVGDWKKEPNGTYMVDGDKQIFYDYAAPGDVSFLMEKWLGLLNRHIHSVKKPNEAADAYADIHMGFVWIHPFFDGNGRMARLLANLPVLKAGYPPIMIPMRKRREYLLCLSRYSLAASPPHRYSAVIPMNEPLTLFREFCKELWKDSLSLVEKAREKQAERDQKK
jgi:Fic family protein